eukprot:CAMPEP_0119336730 /NCGR_PEP_ID=MMETSP1333-20130426/92429_1 /TAXON_ID=418940 /ORGANISM="Scyphosphaera apsteinii, Strain RCC1455" /LENGTH=247 /DNA_ID=CAMNT_0007347581 /DNA_START=280 /DNA_END=1019 /DNA_ORIENTATION=+
MQSAMQHREYLASVRTFQVSNFSRPGMLAPSVHHNLWIPKIVTDRAILDRVRHNQAQCDRLLAVSDDMFGSGLGSTVNRMVLALSLAIRLGRTLIEVPIDTPRWCTTGPQTLQCFYEPWGPCPLPDAGMLAAAPWHNHKSHSDHDAPVLRMSLMHFLKGGEWYHSGHLMFGSKFARTLTTYLFTPRPWIEQLINCTLNGCAFAEPRSQYWVIHMRDSPEVRASYMRNPPSFADYASHLLEEPKRDVG